MVTVNLLHPAERRRIAARMPREPAHDIQLRPLGDGDSRSIIVTSSAQDFVDALLEDLKSPDWRNRLSAMRRRRVGSDDILGLSLPMHRRFQIALFEAWCAGPGRPRLDPAKISGSGIVVRRQNGSQREGWMKRGKSIDGWTVLTQPNTDPDPKLANAPDPGNAAIRAIIDARRGVAEKPAAETVHALYPAPPEVCAALGKTVLFAIIPVSSSETSDLPPPAINFQALPAKDRKEMTDHFSEYLKARPQMEMPRAGAVLSPDWNILDIASIAAEPRLGPLGVFLQQMMMELDALGSSRASADLLAILREIRLPTAEDSLGRPTASVDAAEFVRQAGPILIGRNANTTGFKMPKRWPAMSDGLGDRLCNAALGCLTEQYKARIGPQGKFANDSARYVVRGFIRVSDHEGCPDRLIWSMESEPFRILPWWDGEGPGTTVTLPSISNLKRVKPSVAFAMPPEIANLLKGDMKKLSDGEKISTDGPGIAWICSFSMPFITIVAFIVLNIFLSLLDIIFRWMMFIKICIPIPVPSSPPPSGGSG
jgi:hypothetical protein